MSENSFSAKIENYGFKEDAELTVSGNKKANKNLIKEQGDFFNETLFNLDELSLEDLTRQLSESLKKNRPIFLWSKNREINKIKLDVDRQQLLKTSIETLKGMGEELMHLRADAIVSEEMIVLLSKMNKSKAQAELDRIVEKSRTEISYYQRKIEENRLAQEKLELDFKHKKVNGEADVVLKLTIIEMYDIINQKLTDGSIKDMPVDILHEIFNFFNNGSEGDIESIAKYNKVMSDIDKNQADAFKTYAEGKNKLAESEGTDLENQRKFHNWQFNKEHNIK